MEASQSTTAASAASERTGRLSALGPAIAFWAVLALLPIGRASALPVLIMLIGGIVLALRQPARLFADPAVRVFLLAFLCFWLPIALSALDAYQPDRAWRTTLAMLRFVPVGWFAIWTLRSVRRRQWLARWTTWLLIAWGVDALVQAIVGVNLLGMPHPEDRLNGIFDDNLKLGQVMAALSPLALEYARRQWPPVWSMLLYALLFSVILLAGTRAAWVMFAVVTTCFAVVYARSHGRRFWQSAGALTLLALLVVGIAYQRSPTFEQRIARSLSVLDGDAGGLDFALSTRLPIWATSIDMSQEHWVNGVGVRSFRYAYEEFADADDPWLELMTERGAYHAHQIVLEASSETGTLGVLGWLAMTIIALRWWLSASSKARAAMWPFAVALVAVVFPLNTHLAFYSTFWSLLFWWLVIGMLAHGSRDGTTD